MKSWPGLDCPPTHSHPPTHRQTRRCPRRLLHPSGIKMPSYSQRRWVENPNGAAGVGGKWGMVGKASANSGACNAILEGVLFIVACCWRNRKMRLAKWAAVGGEWFGPRPDHYIETRRGGVGMAHNIAQHLLLLNTPTLTHTHTRKLSALSFCCKKFIYIYICVCV